MGNTSFFNSWVLITIAWWSFVAYWFISARNLKPVKQQEPVPSRLFRLVIFILFSILLFSHWLRVGILARRFMPALPPVETAGVVLTYAGFLVAIWARRHIGQYWSGRITLKVDHKLIKSGPYAYVRHPIYSGLFLSTIGTVLAIGEWRGIAALVLLAITHWHKSRQEDALLANAFGEEFQQYQRQTGSVFPRLY